MSDFKSSLYYDSKVDHHALSMDREVYPTGSFDIPDYPPPSYSTLEPYYAPESSNREVFPLNTIADSPTAIAKPIVIPQITKTIKGTFATPFLRAYSPAIASSGISTSDFLAFIDGLNEAFIANPMLQASGTVGSIMSFVPFPPVTYAGIGLQVASGLSSAGISYFRTRAYVKAANENIFGPKGLQVAIMSTKKMMTKVGVNPEQARRLPQADYNDDLDHEHLAAIYNEGYGFQQTARLSDDPRLQRLDTLRGYVAPLILEGLPQRTEPSNIMKRMNASFADHQEKKQTRKMEKRRRKCCDKQGEHYDDAEVEIRKADRELAEIEVVILKTQGKASRSLNKYGNDLRERAKIERDLHRDLQHLEREKGKVLRERERKVERKMRRGDKKGRHVDRKEAKVTEKIQWVVIFNKEDSSPGDEVRRFGVI